MQSWYSIVKTSSQKYHHISFIIFRTFISAAMMCEPFWFWSYLVNPCLFCNIEPRMVWRRLQPLPAIGQYSKRATYHWFVLRIAWYSISGQTSSTCEHCVETWKLTWLHHFHCWPPQGKWKWKVKQIKVKDDNLFGCTISSVGNPGKARGEKEKKKKVKGKQIKI